jgi:D-sedoheptulose 7-phosphate isomerase
MNAVVEAYLSSVQEAVSWVRSDRVEAAIAICETVRSRDGSLYLCGNGGSAASAMHAACDLTKSTHVAGQRRLRTAVLSDNSAMLTAYANDDCYANVFLLQIEGFITESDALLGISSSGRSENVLKAMEHARSVGAHTIALTGEGTDRMRRAASVAIEVPRGSTQAVEDVHMVVLHAISLALRTTASAGSD